MSIQTNFPAIAPTLNLSFALTKALDPRITFARASTATYYGTQTAKAEENLLLQSQDFTTTWTTTSLTVTSNSSTAPDGTTTAETFTDDATADRHTVSQAISTQLNTNFVFSCFLKAGTGNFAALSLTNSSTASRFATVVVDLSTGTISDTSNSATTTATSSITLIGSGWYRVVLSASQSSVAFGAARICVSDSGTPSYTTFGQPTYSGSGSTIEVWGAQLEQRSAVTAYTPTTTQPITNYIPVLQTAASGVARFDHNPTTFESLGLLIEEQRSNLILQSEDFDTTWAETRATLLLNNRISPAGTLTSDGLLATTDNDTHFTLQTFTGTAASHTFSVYAKASGLNHVALRLFNGTSQVGLAYYNLSTGATGTVTAGTASIVSVGNGWYRCVLTATLAASASCTADIYLASSDNTNSFAGNGFDGVSLWGAQVEIGAFPTSYVATVASQVTRAADAASMTGTNFSSWFNQDQGTIYAEGFLNNPAVTGIGIRRFVEINDGSNNNRIFFGRATTASDLRVIYAVSGVNINTVNGQIASGVFPSAKVAVAYEAADYAFSPNGASVTTSTAANVPIVNRLDIGSNFDNSATTSANGTIRKIAYYPLRVTNAQLQALTS
jgi:hypothetical protein